MSKASKCSLVFYYSWIDNFLESQLNDAEIGQLIKAAVAFDRDGEVPEFKDRALMLAFNTIKNSLIDNRMKYEQVCLKNKENVQKRWDRHKKNDTNVYEHIENDTSVYEGIDEYDRTISNTTVYDSIPLDTKNTDMDNDMDMDMDIYPTNKDLIINNINNKSKELINLKDKADKKSFWDGILGRI